MANYYLILTQHGSNRLAQAQANTHPFVISHLALGDANGLPYLPQSRANATTLVNERARVDVQSVAVVGTQTEVVATIESTIGGFNLHEIALLDEDGLALYLGNFTGAYKPVLTEGASGDMEFVLTLDTDGLAPVVIEMNPTVVIANRQWVIDGFVRISTFDAHVAQNTLEHNNLATLIAAVLLALQQHEAALDPHPQYALESEINPRHLFRFVHNTGSPYATSFGYAAGAVIHQLQGIAQPLGNCLNDDDAIEVQPVTDYEVEGITLGNSLNQQGFWLQLEGYIQFGNYAGQGDTGFSTPSVKLLLLDDQAQTLVEIPLTLTHMTGLFARNGNVGHVMYRLTKDFDLYNLRKPDGQLPPLLYAALSATGVSDSDGGSTDLQILTIESFSVLCSY